MKFAWGGSDAQTEAYRMVSEKMSAGIEAAAILLMGGTPDTVIARYREHVAANTRRLS